MDLSSELISQFAKVTNDNKTSRIEETTLYGEVFEYEDMICVKFDGSEELTPVTTITEKDESGKTTNFKYGAASVKSGDRVSVVLKNHSATITGNLSDPPMGRAEVLINEDSIIARVSEVSVRIDELGVTVNGLTTFTNGLSNGTTVINGGCIQTGTIDAQYLNLTGAITFQDLNTEVQNDINDATEKANDAYELADSAYDRSSTAINTASNAYSVATSITIPDYLKSTYISQTEIQSPTIKGNNIQVYGTFQTVGHDGASEVTTGYMGAAKGKALINGEEVDSYGVALARTWNSSSYAVSNSYVIVTEYGVRLQFGTNSLTVSTDGIWLTPKNGKAYYNGVEIGSSSSATAVFG